MADLSDLISYLLMGAEQKKAIAAEDPYLGFQQGVAEPLSNMVLGAAQNQQYSTGEKVKAGLLTGLMSGLFGGLSSNYQQRASDAYRNALFSSLKGEDIERPGVLSPNLFNAAQTEAKTFKAKQELEKALAAEDAKAKTEAAIKEKFVLADTDRQAQRIATRAKSAGMLPQDFNADLGTAPIGTPLAPNVQKANEVYQSVMDATDGNKTIADAAAKAVLEKGGDDWFKDIAAADQTKISGGRGTIGALKGLAEQFKNYDGSLAEYQLGKNIDGYEAFDLDAALSTMVPQTVRLLGEVGNLNEGEQQRIIKATLGNVTSHPHNIGKRLDALSELANKIMATKLETYKEGLSGSSEALLASFYEKVGAKPSASSATTSSAQIAPSITKEQALAELRARGIIK